jgi:glycosyltransferase involved in cell wall biosynthesis
MKVLIATHRAYPTLGGLENHVYKAAQVIGKRKNVKVLNLAFTNSQSYRQRVSDRFNIEAIQSAFILAGAYPFPFFAAVRFWFEIGEFKPDVIHTHGRYFPSTLIAALYAKIHKVKLVHTEHIEGEVYFSSGFMHGLINDLVNFASKWLLAIADTVTAVSQSTKSFILRKYNVEAVLTPNFIDTRSMNRILKTKLPTKYERLLSKKKPNVLFPYRLVRSKGYSLLLQMAEAAKGFNFIVAGAGEGERAVKNSKYIEYAGQVSHDDLIRLMNRCDIVINLSSQEGLSTTLMEAVHLGKLVLASDIDSNLEILKEYNRASMMDLNSTIPELVEKIERLVFLKEKEAAGGKVFDVSETADMYYDIYRKVLKKE